MAYVIIYKKRFVTKLTNLLEYLEQEWNEAVAKQFLQKLDRRITTLTHQPFIGSPSQKIPTVRGILLSKHNKLFYKISGNKIIILNMYDTRIDPGKNKYL